MFQLRQLTVGTDCGTIAAGEGVKKRERSKDQASVKREAPTHDTPHDVTPRWRRLNQESFSHLETQH